MWKVAAALGAPVAAFAGVASAAVTRFHLAGEDLSKYDDHDFPVNFGADPNSESSRAVENYLNENFIKPARAKGSAKEKLAARRNRFERIGYDRQFDCAFKDDVAKCGKISVPGEWTLPENCDPKRRILYIHGGAFTVGSPVSHRPIITNLANRTGCAIFAPHYSLMPEHPRMQGLIDCRAAYEWIWKNGPDGKSQADTVVIGGDSAGANLTLSLINWIRDKKKTTPTAVFAISPPTDTTMTSPSIETNFESDIMLKALAEPLRKIPRPLLLWALWRGNKISPSHPDISPIFADLSALPPTLIHVSAKEILYDDARRYAAKRTAHGSPVEIQIWDHVCHVWHAFDRLAPEANEAFDEIAAFLKRHEATAS